MKKKKTAKLNQLVPKGCKYSSRAIERWVSHDTYTLYNDGRQIC